ncbi:MAG: PEGA domain-containing protein [candidate division Zixibacteria bacterium]|nr:PEGA domain-containing protein [candidate division Zixibacteria bacterium]
MSICQVCKYQVPDNSSNFCPNCGATIKPQRPEDDEESIPEVRLPDEPAMSSPAESYGGDMPHAEDDLEICHPGEIVGSAEGTGGGQKTGESSVPPPGAESDNGAAQLHKLSAEEAEKIRSSFYAEREDDDEISAADASALLRKMSRPAPEETAPQAVPETPVADSTQRIPVTPESNEAPIGQETQTPEEAEKFIQSPPVRHPAYFRKNFIQLTGAYQPVTGDELVIGDRHYLLRPKKIKPQYVIAGFSVITLVAIVIIAAQFLSPTLPGVGNVVGVVLDEEGRPLKTGAQISLPEAGQRASADGFGFFRFERVPTGTYVIRCQLPNGTLKTDNVSVVNDQVTTISLVLRQNSSESYSIAFPGGDQGSIPPRTEPAGSTSQPSSSTTAPATSSGASTGKSSASLKLNANLEDAKLTIDGETLGVGNLVYKKLAAGSHTVTVNRDGYVVWKGTIQLKANETYPLTVNLEQAGTTSTTKPSFAAEDFYQSGKTQLAAGNASAAVDDFTEAINLKPGMADAYLGRGEAYLQTGNQAAAQGDFIKAGEIYITQKRYQTAQDLFTRVIDADKRSIPALLARAGLFSLRDDKANAIADYDRVLKLDKENFQANYELGKIYFAAGQNKDADKRLRKAQEIDSNVPEVYHLLMLNYLARDDFAKVKKTYADFCLNVPGDQVQAFKTNPKYDAVLRIIGEYQRP